MTAHLRDDVPALRDILTDDGRELPTIRLTPTQLAEVQAFVGTWGQGPMTCTCTHDIDDHQPTQDEWMRGGIAVTETRDECLICDCTDFEEEDTP